RELAARGVAVRRTRRRAGVAAVSLRVVLYAEGPGEMDGLEAIPLAAGEPIDEDGLGAGHLVVRNAIVSASRVPEGAVLFEEPLRLPTRRARGSDLHSPKNLARLLTWLSPARRPN